MASEKIIQCDVCGRLIVKKSNNHRRCGDCRRELLRARVYLRHNCIDATDMTPKEIIEYYHQIYGQPRKRRTKEELKQSQPKRQSRRNCRYCRRCGKRLKVNYFYCDSCLHILSGAHRLEADWVYAGDNYDE